MTTYESLSTVDLERKRSDVHSMDFVRSMRIEGQTEGHSKRESERERVRQMAE